MKVLVLVFLQLSILVCRRWPVATINRTTAWLLHCPVHLKKCFPSLFLQ